MDAEFSPACTPMSERRGSQTRRLTMPRVGRKRKDASARSAKTTARGISEMCHRHSFILTRAGKVHDGMGLTDSHTTIRELAGLDHTDSSTYAFEWQPPPNWPDADVQSGLTQDTAPLPHWEMKSKHLSAIEHHLRRRYPDMEAWHRPDEMTAPRGMKFEGSLYLRGTAITALPDNLSVGGSLDLRGTAITALPDNLSVGGSLDLSGTAITALPDNLSVGGSLYLSGTAITALPDNMSVGGYLYLDCGTFLTVKKARAALAKERAE